MFQTKFLGGTAVYPKFPAVDRVTKIVDLDESCAEFKSDFKKKLESAWDATL
jgi:hypothetical protein